MDSGITPVRGEVVRYFTHHFSHEEWVRPNLDGEGFPTLVPSDNEFLIFPFSVQEIEQVALACDGNKSLGSDRFNFAFIKAFWPLLK